MRAVRVNEHGDPEAMVIEEVDTPEPGPGEARVRIEAAGVNFIDVYHRTGQYALDVPATLGVEGAGVVDAVGPDVTAVETGDRVAYAMQIGSYAEQAVVPSWKLMPVPDDVDTRQAAALMLQGMTAHYLTHDTYPLGSGDTALVYAPAGGVGQLLVQLCKHKGARVIGVTSSEEKAEIAQNAGADEVVLYTDQDIEAEVERITDGEGVDVAYESVGRATFEQSLDCLKPRGYCVLYGQASGAVEPIDPQVLNAQGSLFLTRPSLAHYAMSRQEIRGRTADLFDWVRNGQLSLSVDREFALSDAAEAHRHLEGRQSKGKLLLTTD